MEKLFSLDWLSSQGSQSHSTWSQSGLDTKPGSLKQDKQGRSGHRRGPCDSPHATKKDNLSKPLEAKESKSSRIKESQNSDNQELQCPNLLKQEVIHERIAVKLHKLESRRGLRREGPGPEQEALTRWKRENDHEQEERRRRKRRSEFTEVTESIPSQVKKLGSKHLEKTVSIRLVDIRTSDPDIVDKGMTRRSPASPDVMTNPKPNKANVLSDSADGCLRKGNAGQVSAHTSNGSVGGHLKAWGKFRIPKRCEKPPLVKEQEAPEQHKLLLRPLTNSPEPSYPRTRLRTGTENDGYNSKPGDGEVEPCLKRCHSHQLRGDSSLNRRYGSDIIRRGVLAS